MVQLECRKVGLELNDKKTEEKTKKSFDPFCSPFEKFFIHAELAYPPQVRSYTRKSKARKRNAREKLKQRKESILQQRWRKEKRKREIEGAIQLKIKLNKKKKIF